MRNPTTLVLVFALAACGQPVPAGESQAANLTPNGGQCVDYTHCQTSAQCPAGQLCYGQDCRLPPIHGRPATPRCESYTDPTDPSITVRAASNAAGDRVGCLFYVCDESAGLCKESCTTSDDCAPGAVCLDGTCQRLPNYTNFYYDIPLTAPDREKQGLCSNRCGARAMRPYEMCYHGWLLPFDVHCTEDGLSMVWWDRATYSCGGYVCDRAAGECRSTCVTTDHCAPGYTCVDGACI
jgi:hypothetical protein